MPFWFSLNNKVHDVLQPAGLLLMRLWLAQEFLLAGYRKLASGVTAPEWFAGLPFPFPVSLLPADLNWVLAGGGEIILALLLALGLFGIVAPAGLLFITWVAVCSVHFDLGLAGWDQIETENGLGFKVPLMMAVMLCTLLATGMGRWSIDQLWQRRMQVPTV